MNIFEELIEKTIKVALLPVAVVMDAASIVKDEPAEATEALIDDIFDHP